MNIYDNELREINEAIDASEVALHHLQNAVEFFDSASNWGLFDMLCGGFMSSMVKRNKIGKAKQELQKAQDAVENFRRELQDVEEDIDINIDTSDFLSFADVFFDNSLIDLMMQNRVNDARSQAKSAIRQVKRVRSDLERRQEELVQEAMQKGQL